MLTAEGAKRSNVGLSSFVANSVSLVNSDKLAVGFGLSVCTAHTHNKTLFKVKKQNKIRCAQFEKIKGMTWQKDAFSDGA